MYHPTPQQQKQDNYLFLKSLYFDLIVFFMKRKKYNNADQLKTWWQEIEERYKIKK